MSLLDAMLLEGYRDPREVYIALRTDGLKGSGTIDDPYDGGTRTEMVFSGTINFNRQEIIGVTTGEGVTGRATHGLSNGDSVKIWNVTGQSAAVYNATHSSVTKIDDYAFKASIASVPANPPGPGLSFSSDIYIRAQKEPPGGSISANIRLYWPVMKVTLSSGHGVKYYDLVRISGASESLLNGDFVVVGVGTDFVWCFLTSLPATSFSGSCGCARVVHRFDALLRTKPDGTSIIPINSVVHIGPGNFETRGWSLIFFTNFTSYPYSSNVGWQPKSGLKLRGAGIDVTVLKLVHAIDPLAHTFFIESNSSTNISHFEASDFTLDCNLAGQPRFVDNLPDTGAKAPARVTCGGTSIRGDFTRLSRLRAINWGCQAEPESFVFSAGHSGSRRGIANTIENCIAELPGSTNTHESTVFLIGGDHDTAKALSSAIRNNYCNTDYTDPDDPSKTISSELVAIASTSVNGNSPPASGAFTITTKRPHHLKKGDSFIMNGVTKTAGATIPGPDQLNNPYLAHHTRSYRVTDVLNSNTIETNVLTDIPLPSGYKINFNVAYIGVTYHGTTVGGGSGGVIEGNRQFGWQIACYQDTGSDRDTVVRDNYWSNVKDGLYVDLESVSKERPTTGISVSGTEVTVTTDANAHDLAPGYAVDISGENGVSDLKLINGTHTVKAVTSNSFKFDITAPPVGTAGGTIKYRHRWQKRRVFIENNVIDVYRFDDDSVGGTNNPQVASSPRGIILFSLNLVYPTGFEDNNNVQPAYNFPNAIIRDNVIGYYNGGTDTSNLSTAVSVIRGDSVLVQGNLINLLSKYPGIGADYRLREHAAKDVAFQHNTAATGEVVPALNTNGASNIPPEVVPVPDAYDDIITNISDGALIAVL